jgi:hypothetical protein
MGLVRGCLLGQGLVVFLLTRCIARVIPVFYHACQHLVSFLLLYPVSYTFVTLKVMLSCVIKTDTMGEYKGVGDSSLHN